MTETPTLTAPHYEGDAQALSLLSPDQRIAFEEWMRQLDAYHLKLGSPYGDGSLWKNTGAACWLEYFNDEWDAKAALDKDLTN